MKIIETKYVRRPAHMNHTHECIAFIGINDIPITKDTLPNIKEYRKSNLAFNPTSEMMQVYVIADNQNGLDNFKKDFPTAYITSTPELPDGEIWHTLIFPSENMPETATPLDRFFQGHS